MSPTPEQLSEWRRKLEASRTFEDDNDYAFLKATPEPLGSTKADTPKTALHTSMSTTKLLHERIKPSKYAQDPPPRDCTPSYGPKLVNINQTAAEVYQVDYKARMKELVAEEQRHSQVNAGDMQGGAVQSLTPRKYEGGVLRVEETPMPSPSGRKYGLPVLRALQAKEFEPGVKYVGGTW